MPPSVRSRPSTPVVIAIALPLLLAVVVAAISITARARGLGEPAPPPPATGPLAVVPVDAPDATGPDCGRVLAALPAELGDPGDALPTRPLAEPAPPGVRAWVAAPQPVVLRCGLPRPVELTPTSALLEINGVQWLQLSDDAPNPQVVTYVVVDRPVYVVLTEPVDSGSGPLQQVSDVVRGALPAVPVKVR
jgi:hypothetical protein